MSPFVLRGAAKPVAMVKDALQPISVAVERPENGRLRYRVTDPRGRSKTYLQQEILHLRYRLGPDGVMGISSIQLARETFSLALTQQEQATRQAGWGTLRSTIYGSPKRINVLRPPVTWFLWTHTAPPPSAKWRHLASNTDGDHTRPYLN